MRGRAAAGLAWVTALLLLAAAPSAWALQLDELMSLLRQTRSAEARFTEQRRVKGMDAPLVSTGTLSFSAPDRFVRSTLTPKPEQMAVEGKIVTLSRNGRSRTMVVDAAPEMEAIVEAVRGTLTGNADSLKVHFTTGVSGNAEQWTLELLPIEPRLKVLLASVRLSGRRGELRQVEMRMADGDSSTMAIETLSSVPAGAPAAGPPAAAASRP